MAYLWISYLGEILKELCCHVQKVPVFTNARLEPCVNLQQFVDDLISLTPCVASQRQELGSFQMFLSLLLGFLESFNRRQSPTKYTWSWWWLWWWFSTQKQVHYLFYATWWWDEWGGFPLPSSQTVMGEQLVQGRYAVAWGRFKPATFRLQGTEHTTTPPRPIIVVVVLIVLIVIIIIIIIINEKLNMHWKTLKTISI